MNSTLATLRHLEAEIRAKGMSKPERVKYLHNKGWRSSGTTGVGVWTHPDGRSMTTRRAVEAQLLADMDAGADTLGG